MIFYGCKYTHQKQQEKEKGWRAIEAHVEACAQKIAAVANGPKIVVEVYTLPVRTARKIKEVLDQNEESFSFEVLSNPGFPSRRYSHSRPL